MVESMNILAKISCADVDIRSRILTFRGVQVMLDRDLAELYGVDVKRLNQQVNRNLDRFPERFMHQLTMQEFADLKLQIATSSSVGDGRSDLKLQIATSSWGGVRKPPKVFTEQGISMLSAVLHTQTAVQVSIRIMDAFVAMRRFLQANGAVLQRLETVEMKQLTMGDQLDKILDAMQDKTFPPQKIFFDGQFYDAFAQMKKFIRSAKKELIIIDPYFDDSILPIIAQKRAGVRVTVVNCPRGAKLLHAVDVNQFNLQYANSLVIKTTDKFHDRFLIIDNASVIHIGASLNYLGKKCFACSTFDPLNIPEMLARLPK